MTCLGKYDFSTIPEDLIVARVAVVFQNKYRVLTPHHSFLAKVTGKMIFAKKFPAVGDWVLLNPQNNLIMEILPRKSLLSRKKTGNRLDEQLIAANLDYVFITTSLNKEFNLARLERYLAIVRESKATPVFVLNKMDLTTDLHSYVAKLQKIAGEIKIHLISALYDEGLAQLQPYLKDHNTIALIGSSGVGKSTLLNKLAGDQLQKIGEIRDDDKGRHVTTNRQLFVLPNFIIIDTPGMREIQLWDSSPLDTFTDIVDLATKCKFNNCCHQDEPDCAVKQAVATGTLAVQRLENYRKIVQEQRQIDQKKKRSDT